MTPGSYGSIVLRFGPCPTSETVWRETVQAAARRIQELNIAVGPVSIQKPSEKGPFYTVEISFEGVSPERTAGLRAALNELGQAFRQFHSGTTIQLVPQPFERALVPRAKL